MQIGRLYVGANRTRGRGLRVRRLHPDNPGVEIWLARWMIYVAWGRPTGCECDGCRCGHEDEMGAETR